jgi:hypothetical protein
MPTEDDVRNQQHLLQTYRRTLAVYVERLALQGAAHVSPEIVHGIDDARTNIRTIKHTLRQWGIAVADLPHDEEPAPVPSESVVSAPLDGGSMSFFDQRGQSVTYQYNAAGDINVGAVHTPADLAGQLEKLRTELSRAEAAEAITQDAATDAGYQITKAIQQTQKPAPNTATIEQHLTNARTSLRTSGAPQEFLLALDNAIAAVRRVS